MNNPSEMPRAKADKRPKVVAIVGPTASGKSALAVGLAKRFGGAVISADSRQVYQGLDIGTGKITSEEQEGVAHYLLDICDPGERFSVADFLPRSTQALHKILGENKLPIIAGGTGLYIDALLKGFQIPPTDPRLRGELEKHSAQWLIRAIRKRDPALLERLDPANHRRLVRALEVLILAGIGAMTKRIAPLYDVLWLGILFERAALYAKIDERLAARLEDGLVEEVRTLLSQGVSPAWLDALGLEYRYVSRYLAGQLSYQAMVRALEGAIHAYARRQLTWFRRNPRIHWVKTQKEAEQLLSKFLNLK